MWTVLGLMHTFLVEKDGLMPSKYNEETRARGQVGAWTAAGCLIARVAKYPGR